MGILVTGARAKMSGDLSLVPVLEEVFGKLAFKAELLHKRGKPARFESTKIRIKEADLILADTFSYDADLATDLVISNFLNKKVIALSKEGEAYPSVIDEMKNINVLKFKDTSDLKSKLRKAFLGLKFRDKLELE